jgi:kynurenine formamidase
MTPPNRVSGQPRPFTRTDFDELAATRRNWGRWGSDDQRGALNLIDDDKRRAAASLVRSGRIVSLCRPFPKDVAANNPRPALHYLETAGQDALDFYGISYHGVATTHIDALCHMWHETGMWNGRDPQAEFHTSGFTWGDIEQWGDGIVTRGVLLDVPRHRGVDCVEQDEPVHGWELEAICAERGVELAPGDALVVHCGRDAWSAKHGRPWGSGPNLGRPGPRDPRPGLHASCLEFIRDTDASLLVWDMLDLLPNGLDVVHSVHAAIYLFGVALVDNALLGPLAAACQEEGRDDFLFTLGPLRVKGGTGSPVNPLALF